MIPILLYHSVDTHVSPAYAPWAVTPRLFAEHLDYVLGQGYTVLTVGEYVRALDGAPLPEKPLVLSFDDGLLDFYTGAMPVLQKRGLRATLYVTTGCVGQTSRWLAPLGEGERPMMSWDQVREIAAYGIECGAHTVTHPQLDLLPPSKSRAEVSDSKKALEDALGRPVTTFAYPHGYYSLTIRRQVQEAGYTSACAVNHAISTLSDDRYALSRVIVKGDTSVETLAGYLAGELPPAPGKLRLRSRAWRMARFGLRAIGKNP